MVHAPYRRDAPVSRQGVLSRDGHVCCYCGGRATTVDHVLPRSRGGKHEWLNVVSACEADNWRKDDKTPAELDWPMRYQPRVPTRSEMILGAGRGRPQEAWLKYA
jgi:5-methylcytosine-specific restriction endonuclease McrA